MLSKVHSTQSWLSQFLPAHRRVAALLLDNLHIVSSEDMQDDLRTAIEQIIPIGAGKAALLPIREVTEQESIYDENDQSISPKLQDSQEPLGSEAFISNLYTQFSRSRPRQFCQGTKADNKKSKTSPSISFMKDKKFRYLFLVDDLIGSGDRVVLYLNALFRNKTINSWVSYGYLHIHIVSFMATEHGRAVVSKAIKRRNNVKLHVIHTAPLLADLAEEKEIVELCKSYADKRIQYPLGYKNSAVRVVFTHSAPNNLPSILYRPIYEKYRPNNVPEFRAKKWKALFPGRTIPNHLKQDVISLKDKPSIRIDIIKLLSLVKNGVSKQNDLVRIMNKSLAYIQKIIKLCERMRFIRFKDLSVSITDMGKAELATKKAPSYKKYRVESKSSFYYPKQ